MRRLLSEILLSQCGKVDCVVVSLDPEKALIGSNGPISLPLWGYWDFLTNPPEVLILAGLDPISCFSQFLGYKIHFSKWESLPLGGLCEVQNKIKTLIGDKMIINSTIKAWWDIRSLEGLAWGNIDFYPATTDRSFDLWDSKVTIGHSNEKESLLSFDQLWKKYTTKRVFRYLQIQSFLNDLYIYWWILEKYSGCLILDLKLKKETICPCTE